jgi:hypothetical protein
VLAKVVEAAQWLRMERITRRGTAKTAPFQSRNPAEAGRHDLNPAEAGRHDLNPAEAGLYDLNP